MCDHYDSYFPEEKEAKDKRLSKQLEALKPIKRPLMDIYQEIDYLKNRIKQLEKEVEI